MLPSILSHQVRTGLEDQLRASFAPSTKSFDRLIEDFVETDGALAKGPWITLELPFRRTEGTGEFFPRLPLGFRAYRHQDRAFRRLAGDKPRSTLIATGTGSGKTECFLLPILDACARAKGKPGIKAIIIYPMNALASDQARRMAALIARTEALSGVRVGIYADERPIRPSDEMTKDTVIDSREALVRDPPDILLTNYKMLDYMLIRPNERNIWLKNRPETLQYLVVDELHTFDGAQGTDLASLVRRLKARLDIPKGHLCCIGTSATLGGPESLGDLLSYAKSVFDEPFDNDSVVVEDRQTASDYLDGIMVKSTDVPQQSDVRRIVEGASEAGRIELIKAAFEALFAEPAPVDVDNAAWRGELGDLLNGHAAFQKLLEITQGRPTLVDDIVGEFKRGPDLRSWSDQDVGFLIDILLALVAHARRADKIGDVANRPFLNVRSQLWVRELRRMVATVAEAPLLLHYDDLIKGEQDKALPIVHCRSCGGAGWATVVPPDGRLKIKADPQEVYRGYFGYSDLLRFLFREVPVAGGRKNIAGQTLPGLICPSCLEFRPGEDKPGEECPSCKGGPLFEGYLHRPGKATSDGFRVDHDCVFCGSPSGLGILGAQSITLVSGMVGTVFGSDFNDDPKLLTFSDSVQDAAHRAAVLQARNATTVFRSGLARFVCEEVEPSVANAMAEAPSAMLRSQATPEDFVATFIPADMQWRQDYNALLDGDALPEKSRLPEYLEERLAWETFAELTFRGRLGTTVERSGVAVAHADAELVDQTASDIVVRLPDELGPSWQAVDPDDMRHFLLGLADHMRSQGAVVCDVTRVFVQREAKWYATLKVVNGGKNSLPNYSPAAPKPVFPSNRSLSGFETYVTEAAGGWYRAWFHACFDRLNPLLSTDCADFYRLVFGVMEASGLAERLPVGGGGDGGPSAWGLKPSEIRVFSETALQRCTRCGNSHRVPAKYSNLWQGMPCTRVGCHGAMGEDEDSVRTRFRSRLMTTGRVKRVVAAEHTSLLSREDRQWVETRFMQDTPKSWYPNLLAATPTLEMGINIGDLSSLVLCSVPPEQANYVQRIGRTGRRDGNSLNVTVATARSHDMWFWADPSEMISGQVKTPGVHLKALAILKRQFAAFTLDRWVAEEGAGVATYGKVGDAVRARLTENKKMFPNYWFEFVSKRATNLFEDFVKLFPEMSDPISIEQLHGFAHGGHTDGLAYFVAQEFADVAAEITSIDERIRANKVVSDRIKKQVPPDLDQEDKLKELDRERRSLRKIRDDIRSTDTLAFLTDRGVLPNYAFPEEGVTLKSILFRAEKLDEEEQRPTVTEYLRPAASALSEFAPGASFYTQGRKLKIDQIDLTASPIEYWRVCPECIHIEKSEFESTESACPACGCAMWADRDSRRPMIRLKQVLAVGSDRSTRIPEDGDDRDRKSFDRDYLPAIERDQIGQAFAMDEDVTPFAYEFLRRCTFREVNFGQAAEAPTGQKVAGQRRTGHGFQICRSCGKVQDRDALRRLPPAARAKGLHLMRCQEASAPTNDTFVSVVYIYREFSSEAIRMLLPFASSVDGAQVDSFRAAIDLGLRLHFKGRVAHLRSTLVEAKEGPLTRRYLYLYDSVPGGTGYLKQLAADPAEMGQVLRKSLDHMQACVCNADPKKDGCPRCIRSHASTFGRGEVSRNWAVGQLTELVVAWDGIHPIGSVSDIRLNKALESELEQMFIERLRRTVRDREGVFNKIAVAGKPGYAIKLGRAEWRLEPQCWLQDKFSNVPVTRADFVLWPAIPGPDSPKPLVIYLDGWQFHAQTVAEDLSLRQKLIRSGHVHVWSATWDDVAGASDGNELKHYWSPITKISPALHRLAGGEDLSRDSQDFLDASPFDQFMIYLADPDADRMAKRALCVAMSSFAVGREAGKNRETTLETVERFGGPSALDTFAATQINAAWGRVGSNDSGMLAAAIPQTWTPPAWPVIEDITVVLGFEHRLAESSEAKKCWNGALRLTNLIQFCPYFYVGCAESVEPPPAFRIEGASGDEAWLEIERDVLGELAELVRRLRQAGVPAPSFIHEAVGPEGEVLGTFELAWPDHLIGVVADGALLQSFAGWTVFAPDTDPDMVEKLMEKLL
ncbi:DEAD/DEAH box helicase [Bradyrhizobium elkanii]|uniref:DEAD/DEAH box helicase n=1 Tax=Bradyrhizobium elkanii TaxID=29448 RepID=UPI0004AD8F6E|nr:DEAD/DEAH box helicase [Bradyrhizobium elkanii]